MNEYTIEVIVVLLALFAVDWVSGARLILRPRFICVLACLSLGTLGFDGYLDARPVITYGWRYLSGVQLWVVPIEDFGYGIALATVAILGWELMGRAAKRRS